MLPLLLDLSREPGPASESPRIVFSGPQGFAARSALIASSPLPILLSSSAARPRHSVLVSFEPEDEVSRGISISLGICSHQIDFIQKSALRFSHVAAGVLWRLRLAGLRACGAAEDDENREQDEKPGRSDFHWGKSFHFSSR